MPTEKSTNVRTNGGVPPAPAWVRLGLRALDAALPPAAAWVGERLFLTPPRHQTPNRERAAIASAEAFDVPFRGGRLRAWRWGGAGAPVLLVHGWGGRGGQLAPFAPPLVEAGLPVVTFDGPGHGASSGWLSSAPDFAQAIRALAARLGGLRAVVAHSMGAPATVLALRDGLSIEAAVFVGPSVGPRGFLGLFGQALGLSDRTRRAVAGRLEARFGPFEEFDVRTEAAAMKLPLLVVHDRQDAEVGVGEGESIARAWPGAELALTEGLGHRRVLRDPRVVARVTGFVARALRASEPFPRLVSSRCATPGCAGRVCPSWHEGSHCPSCALSADLFDRSARQALLA